MKKRWNYSMNYYGAIISACEKGGRVIKARDLVKQRNLISSRRRSMISLSEADDLSEVRSPIVIEEDPPPEDEPAPDDDDGSPEEEEEEEEESQDREDLRALVDAAVRSATSELRNDVQNLHVDLIRQFQLQQNEIAAVIAENDALRKENDRLRRNIDDLWLC